MKTKQNIGGTQANLSFFYHLEVSVAALVSV
jgi:hypothetical protein